MKYRQKTNICVIIIQIEQFIEHVDKYLKKKKNWVYMCSL